MAHRLLALLLTALPAGAGAGEAGWTDAAPVAELRPTVHGRFLVSIPVGHNPSECRQPRAFYHDRTGPGSERIYELLLAAAVREMPVRVHVTGVCDLDGRAAIDEAALRP
ncbi:MAG TPA: hypothetical protein VKA55_09130 [Gammaproteobacteria bacterium]|nr:hypothetical protein [Gammaproteobacteria bacterium]